jgi:hypothetical protein
MQQLLVIKILSLATVLAALIHFSYPLLVSGNDAPRIEAAPDRLDLAQDSASQLDGGCAGADPADLVSCQALEGQILASTVRIEIEAWVSESIETGDAQLSSYRHEYGNGHGTVKDGRYLVTHNHYGVPLSSSENDEAIGYGSIAIFQADGQEIVAISWPAPFQAIFEDSETLVLDFGMVEGQGFFEARGLASAEFRAWQQLDLRPGMEVAKVDWDGAAAHVNWVTLESIIIDEAASQLVLSEDLTPGASGGGVFLGGYHVANNWAVVDQIGTSGEMLNQESIAALNSTSWINPISITS